MPTSVVMATVGEDIDPYAILGVDPDAGQDHIEAAWKRLIRVSHPDVNPGFVEEANERTKTLNHAYDILRDPARRAQWDREVARHRVRDVAGDADDSPPRGAAGEACGPSATLGYQVRCGFCLGWVPASASDGQRVRVHCSACARDFEAVVAVRCEARPRSSPLGHGTTGRAWMAYELRCAGRGRPTVYFEGPSGLVVKTGERFSLTWGWLGDAQPAWWMNVDQRTDMPLVLVRDARSGLRQRVAAAAVLMVLVWAGLSSGGLSVGAGFTVSSLLAGVLVSPMMPVLVRAIGRRASGSAGRPPRPSRSAAEMGWTALAIAGGAVLAWGVSGSQWGSGAGDWSVLAVWGTAGLAMLGASVHSLRRYGDLLRRRTSRSLARRLVAGLGAAAIGALIVGLTAGGLARAAGFAVGCVVVAAVVWLLAARYAHLLPDFRPIAGGAAGALFAWLLVVGNHVDGPRAASASAIQTRSTTVGKAQPARRALGGSWEGDARGTGSFDAYHVRLELRRLRSGRYAGRISMGGCHGLLRQVDRAGARRAFRVQPTTMPCPSIDRVTARLSDGQVRARVRAENGALTALLHRRQA